MKSLARPAGSIILSGASLVLCFTSGAPGAFAQISSARPSSAQPSSSAPGFSIESEMLTYRALESNSDAVACEVAALLSGQSAHFSSQSPGARCDIAGVDATQKIVILPFASNIVSEFAMWRSDMQTMAEMLDRTKGACETSGKQAQRQGEDSNDSTRGGGGEGYIGNNLNLQMVNAALGLFSSGYSTTPVGGTIEDQAFIDNVGRDLRVLNVTVLSPSSYMPGSLDPIEPSQSPFVTRLVSLLQVHDCLLNAKGKDDPGVQNIQNFIDSLSDRADISTSAAASPNARNSNSAAGRSAAGNSAAATNSDLSSHLYSILAVDGLAHALGIHLGYEETMTAPAKVHLLLLKALESGGEVSRFTNIFRTTVSYSGGAVGTYALFGLDGQVECEGNVYDYAGPVPFRNFQRKLRAYKPDPSSQVIFHRGQCPGVSAAK